MSLERRPSEFGSAALPDINDPQAIADWLDAIERDSGRISIRQGLVLEVAAASHDLFLHKTRPLPLWVTSADRHRAWATLMVGLAIAFFSTVALAYGDISSPAALTPFPIACLLWLFFAAYETARNLRNQNQARTVRAQNIIEATTRRDIATALLDKHEQEFEE